MQVAHTLGYDLHQKSTCLTQLTLGPPVVRILSRVEDPSVTPQTAAQDSHLEANSLWPSACSKMAKMVNSLRLHQWEFLCLSEHLVCTPGTTSSHFTTGRKDLSLQSMLLVAEMRCGDLDDRLNLLLPLSLRRERTLTTIRQNSLPKDFGSSVEAPYVLRSAFPRKPPLARARAKDIQLFSPRTPRERPASISGAVLKTPTTTTWHLEFEVTNFPPSVSPLAPLPFTQDSGKRPSAAPKQARALSLHPRQRRETASGAKAPTRRSSNSPQLAIKLRETVSGAKAPTRRSCHSPELAIKLRATVSGAEVPTSAAAAAALWRARLRVHCRFMANSASATEHEVEAVDI